MAGGRVVWLVGDGSGADDADRLRGRIDGATVEVVPDLDAVGEQVRNGRVDCVICGGGPADAKLTDVTDRVATLDATVPVIAYADGATAVDPQTALENGASGYIHSEDEEPVKRLAALVRSAIGDRRLLPRSEGDRLRELAELTPDVLWLASGDWEEMLFVNSAYEEIWGRPTEELRQDPTSFVEAVHPDDRDDVRRHAERLTQGHPADLEFRVNPAEDYSRWVWVMSKPVQEDGEVARIAGFTRDITDRKERERQLEHQNERLDDFAHIVAHDLRNPLTLAAARLELAQETGDPDHLTDVDTALTRIDDMIDDMLRLARDGKAVSDALPFALSNVVADAWELATAEAAEEATPTLTVVDDLPRITGDPDRVQRLLTNLFTNALQHVGHDVAVEVGWLPDADGFYVADDGAGIPPEDRTEVFDAGYTTVQGGTGYGLTIVSEIATAHDWQVTLTESEDGGARFEFAGVERAPE